jgi:acyl carrier protein
MVIGRLTLARTNSKQPAIFHCNSLTNAAERPKHLSMETMKYTTEIRSYIVSNFLFGDESSLKDDTSFMESGILDSTGVLELVTFLESTYGVKVQDQEMVPENLDSVNRAAAFVARKGSQKAA